MPQSKEYFKDYHKKNKDRRNQEAKEYYEKNKPKVSSRGRKHLLKKYNITEEQWTAIFISQNGLCAGCLKPETRIVNGTLARLCIDHCHKTGIVRGLLCWHCNLALGYLKDNAQTLRNLAQYIEKINE